MNIENMHKGQSMYRKRMRRMVTETEYARWVFLLGEYFKSQSLSEIFLESDANSISVHSYLRLDARGHSSNINGKKR